MTLMSLQLRHSSFSNPYIASPMSQLILQPFYHFTYITQLILLPFHCFIYVIGTSPMSQLILQPFRCFIYTTAHSTTLLPLYLQHSSFYCHSVASPTSPGKPPMPLWWCLIYSLWFCNLQWLRPAGLYERCKLSLELKRLKTPALKPTDYAVHSNFALEMLQQQENYDFLHCVVFSGESTYHLNGKVGEWVLLTVYTRAFQPFEFEGQFTSFI